VAGSSIIKLLSPDVSRWISALSRKLEDSPELLSEQMGTKLVNLDKYGPEFFQTYEPRTLFNELRDANEGSSDIGLMAPSKFQEAAWIKNFKEQDSLDKLQNIRDLSNEGILLDEIPEFIYTNKANEDLYYNFLDKVRAKHGQPSRSGYGNYATDAEIKKLENLRDQKDVQITDHEGRHRNKFFEDLGRKLNLVRFIPRSKENLISKMNPETSIIGQEGNNIGKIKDVIKILSVAPAVGALSQIKNPEYGALPQEPDL